MITNKRITIDLLSGNRPETIHVVQGDAYSRAVEIGLKQGMKPWTIPGGVSVAVEYVKPDGTKGLYDTLPDGTPAWSADGNTLILILSPQMLTANGTVVTQVRIMSGDAQLSLFKFYVYVHQKITGAESEDYINWRSAFLPQVENAKAGQYFEIEEVDSAGRAVKVRAVDAPQGGGGRADWNAAEGEPGYIANRTHWDDRKFEVLAEKVLTYTHELDDVFDERIELIEGETYVVNWNGADYRCRAESLTLEGIAIICLGDPGVFTGESNGLPFTIANFPVDISSYTAVMGHGTYTEGETVTVSVSGAVGTIHKLDNKYIDAEWMAKKNIFTDYTFIPETTFNFTWGDREYIVKSPPLEIGKEYTVTWNGTEYHLACKRHPLSDYFESLGREAIGCLGNVKLGNYSDGATDEPFFIEYGVAETDDNETGLSVTAELESGEATFSVRGYLTVPVKMPYEYLPKELDFSPVETNGMTREDFVVMTNALNNGKEAYYRSARMLNAYVNNIDNQGYGIFADWDRLYYYVFRHLGDYGHAPIGKAIPLTSIPGENEPSVDVGTYDFTAHNDKVQMWEAVNDAEGKLQTYRPVWKKADSELDETSERPVQNKVVAEAMAEKVSAPATAEVGQTIVVKSVDGDGKPTEWEAVDLPDSSQNANGLTAAQIAALDGMFQVCGFIKDDVSSEYNAFRVAFGLDSSGDDSGGGDSGETTKTLTSISAVYSGGEVAVGTAVTDLTGIVVTAHYSDGTSATVTGYTLSGTIAEGSNTITVSYGGKTATFTVTGVAESGGVSNETTWTSGVPYTFEPISDSYPDKSTGEIKAYNNWERSPYLYCAGATTLRGIVKYQSGVLNGTNDNAFYDADKNYVAPVETFTFKALNNAEVGTYVDIPIPENAAYFIVSGGNLLLTGNNNTNNEPFIEYVPYE